MFELRNCKSFFLLKWALVTGPCLIIEIGTKKSLSRMRHSFSAPQPRNFIAASQLFYKVSQLFFTKCFQVSSKDEDFLDLSVDVEQNASITHCLRVFSNMETLQGEQKYYCENCCSKQEVRLLTFYCLSYQQTFIRRYRKNFLIWSDCCITRCSGHCRHKSGCVSRNCRRC